MKGAALPTFVPAQEEMICFYFTYGFCDDVVHSSDYMALNIRMITGS
jgi:hypothetical protein